MDQLEDILDGGPLEDQDAVALRYIARGLRELPAEVAGVVNLVDSIDAYLSSGS